MRRGNITDDYNSIATASTITVPLGEKLERDNITDDYNSRATASNLEKEDLPEIKSRAPPGERSDCATSKSVKNESTELDESFEDENEVAARMALQKKIKDKIEANSRSTRESECLFVDSDAHSSSDTEIPENKVNAGRANGTTKKNQALTSETKPIPKKASRKKVGRKEDSDCDEARAAKESLNSEVSQNRTCYKRKASANATSKISTILNKKYDKSIFNAKVAYKGGKAVGAKVAPEEKKSNTKANTIHDVSRTSSSVNARSRPKNKNDDQSSSGGKQKRKPRSRNTKSKKIKTENDHGIVELVNGEMVCNPPLSGGKLDYGDSDFTQEEYSANGNSDCSLLDLTWENL